MAAKHKKQYISADVSAGFKINSFFNRLEKDFRKYKALYLLLVPVLIYYIVFRYLPIYGTLIAFKDYSPRLGIMGSDWVGFDNFIKFFKSVYFGRVLKNTILISFYDIVFGFPAPIIFALLLNEIKSRFFQRSIQTITYLPHFISTVVIAGMLLDFSSKSGLFNNIIAFFGGQTSDLLMRPELFRPIYIASGIWSSIGWGSIVYLAALTGIDQEQYEASYIDGANRLQQIWHITLPGILPTITILFILKIGGIMNIGSEKILLLYSPVTYETADVISTFIYRKGLLEFDYSFSTAAGLFNSVINIILLIAANKLSRKANESSLW